MASDTTWATEYKAHGFNMLAAGTDHGLLMAGVAGLLDSVRDQPATKKKTRKK